MSKSRRFRFSTRTLLFMIALMALSIAFIRQNVELRSLRPQSRLHATKKIPTAVPIGGISFVEAVESKTEGHTCINKVFIAKDGRKRYESITSKNGLVTIYDDWGIQRLHLSPIKKTATAYAAVEEFGKGFKLKDWLSRFVEVVKSPESELGRRNISGTYAVGYSGSSNAIPDGTVEVWVDEDTGELMQVKVDTPSETMKLFDIGYRDTLDESLFKFTAPEDYSIVHAQFDNR